MNTKKMSIKTLRILAIGVVLLVFIISITVMVWLVRIGLEGGRVELW